MVEPYDCPWCGGQIKSAIAGPVHIFDSGLKVEAYTTREGECDTCGTKWVIDTKFEEV